MSGILADLTGKQHQAIRAMLSSSTVTAAAAKVGVNERTMRRWLDNEVFRVALLAAEESLIDHATRRLVAGQEMAIGILFDTMDGTIQPDAVKLRAAQIALEHLVKLRMLRDVERRLSALEGTPSYDT